MVRAGRWLIDNFYNASNYNGQILSILFSLIKKHIPSFSTYIRTLKPLLRIQKSSSTLDKFHISWHLFYSWWYLDSLFLLLVSAYATCSTLLTIPLYQPISALCSSINQRRLFQALAFIYKFSHLIPLFQRNSCWVLDENFQISLFQVNLKLKEMNPNIKVWLKIV